MLYLLSPEGRNELHYDVVPPNSSQATVIAILLLEDIAKSRADP